MKISDLAALVIVRSHINAVMGDKSVCTKEDFKPLNEVRVKLDKKFISVLKETDIDSLFNPLIFVDNSTPVVPMTSEEIYKLYEEQKKNIFLEESTKGPVYFVEEPVSVEEPLVSTEVEKLPESVNVKSTDQVDEKSIKNNDEAAELELIAERIKAQKEALKKEGRSNKRLSKMKEENGTDK